MATAEPSDRNYQTGVALIEFALVLPLLLAIAVGIIYYGYAFVLKTAVEHAAKNGAQAAVAVSPLPTAGGGFTKRFTQSAKRAANDSLAWLPQSVTDAAGDPVILSPGGDCGPAYGVRVTLPLSSGDNPVLPQFALGRFRIPPLGNNSVITSTACVTL